MEFLYLIEPLSTSKSRDTHKPFSIDRCVVSSHYSFIGSPPINIMSKRVALKITAVMQGGWQSLKTFSITPTSPPSSRSVTNNSSILIKF